MGMVGVDQMAVVTQPDVIPWRLCKILILMTKLRFFNVFRYEHVMFLFCLVLPLLLNIFTWSVHKAINKKCSPKWKTDVYCLFILTSRPTKTTTST